MKYHRAAGVTLIELMIVVIVAILGAIAVPSSRSYLVRTHHTEAKTALLQIQVAQEKFCLQHNRYVSVTADISKASPSGLDQALTTPNGMYVISLATGQQT
jgi:type IV pilus assembly protein PilE